MRPYIPSADLPLLLDHLRAGGRLAYYGVGDLAWRLQYELRDAPLEKCVLVSEQGWIILTPRWQSLDVYLRPEIDPTPWVAEAENRLRELVPPAMNIRTQHVLDTETALISALEAAGFTRNDNVGLVMHCELPTSLPAPTLTEGFFPRTMHTQPDAERWGAACAIAFDIPEKVSYHLVMASPLYDPRLDVVVIDPEGEVAAFATGWFDPVTRLAQVEPVGTRPQYQRMGLGKVALWGVLKRLAEQGATSAMLHTRLSNTRAQFLYTSMGFRETMKVYRYEKSGLPA